MSSENDWPNLPDDWRCKMESLSWVTQFHIRGVPVGGSYDPLGDDRFAAFVAEFPDAVRILELGSLEGGFTRLLAGRPATQHVDSIEGRQTNADKQQMLLNWGGLTGVRLLVRDLDVLEIRPLTKYDVVFCVGLLYHLQNPLRLLQNLAAVSESLFLWTHYSETASAVVGDYQGAWYAEYGIDDPLSGLSDKSFWPTLPELLRMLADSGYTNVKVLSTAKQTPGAQAAVTLTARKKK